MTVLRDTRTLPFMPYLGADGLSRGRHLHAEVTCAALAERALADSGAALTVTDHALDCQRQL